MDVEHVEITVPHEPLRTHGHHGRNGHGRHRPVGVQAGGSTHHDHVLIRDGCPLILWSDHRDLVAQLAQGPRQAEHLTLDAARTRQRIRRQHPDLHERSLGQLG